MITYAKIVNGTVSGSIQSTPITVVAASGSSVTELIANTSVTWDWGTSPVDANGVAIYPNYPYDSTGVFIGSFLKAAPATYTVNWNVIPIGFSASSITPLYDSAGTIQNFTTVTPTKYTFTYTPNTSPAQIVIKAGAVSNGELKLNNDVYSQAVANEYRPYVIPEIALMYGTGTGTGQVTNLGKSIVDTEVNPPVTRLYTTDTTSGNKRAIKLTFVNFQDVPTNFSESGYPNSSVYRPFWFDSTDITAAISYSNIAQGTASIPTNTATTYGFYINISTLTAYPATTAATRLSKVRAVEMSLGTNAYKYSGVLKFQVLNGSYYDKALGISNVDGPALYYGIFNYSYIVVDTLPTKPTGVTYANISTLKFNLNIYRALTDTSTTLVPTVTYGKLGPITVDATDPFGLTYTCTYTPSTTVASYIETVNIPNSWKTGKVSANFYSLYNQGSQKTFEVRQEPVKYTSSTAATNIVVPFLYFYTNTAVYTPTTPVNLRVLAPDGSTKVTFSSILNGGTTITVPIQGYGLSGGITYTVNIPTTYAIDGYGNSLEDLTKTSVPRTFTLDSTPLTIGSPVIKSTLSVATPTLPISFTFNKAVTSINSTATDFLSIRDITNAGAPQTVASLQHDIYSTNFTDSPAISGSNYTLPTSIRLNNNFNDPNSGGNTRIFKVDRTYQLNINIPYCKDVFNNTGTLYSETFVVQKTDLNLSDNGGLTNSYGSDTISLTAPQILYKDNVGAYVQLTTGSTTYRSDIDNLGVSISGTNITIKPSSAIYLTSTTYTLTIPAGFVQDYVGNSSLAFTKTFTTVAMGSTRGEYTYTSGDNLFTVPFGVNSISVVLIGPGPNVPLSVNSRISAGALAWVNSIPVVAGDVIHVSVDYYAASYTTLTKNGVVLVTAEGGTVGRRSMPLFDASIAGLEKGGQAGGLSALDTQTNFDTDTYYYSHPGSAGGYTGYNSDPNICAHGADGTITSTSASGSNLSGTGSGGYYGQGGLTTLFTGSDSGNINNPTLNPGAARILWGPGRAFPSTDVA